MADATAAGRQINVSVVYLGKQSQFAKTLMVREGADIGEVLRQSGFWQAFPDCRRDAIAVGVFGKVLTLEDRVSAADRIEVYRPLNASPRDARRRRASGA